jgi:hypothetical protein
VVGDLCFDACFSQLEPKPPSGGQTKIGGYSHYRLGRTDRTITKSKNIEKNDEEPHENRLKYAKISSILIFCKMFR